MEVTCGYLDTTSIKSGLEMDKASEIFIERTKSLMKKKGIKQKEICAYSGYTTSGISNLLQSGNKSFGVLKAIAQMLGTSTDYLLGLSDQDENAYTQPIPVVPFKDAHKTQILQPSGLTNDFAIFYSPEEIALPESWFCVRVPDSYAEPEYYENDIVLIEPTEEVSSNELALVYIPGMNQSVICYAKKGFLSYALVPKNPEFSDNTLKLKPDELKIIGKCRDILKEEL